MSPSVESVERGILVIISSPSGAGKTTLARKLLAEFEDRMSFSISYTTRQPRVNEIDGRDYCFVDDDTFERMVHAGEFAESAEVHGNRYGTSRAAVERALVGGRDMVFDVDYQGGRDLSAQWPADSLKIFILPPDLAILEDRLRRRATDADEVIKRRLHKALEELEHHDQYEHLIINDDLDQAYGVLRAIYLVRRFDGKARDDVSHDITLMAEIVERNRASGADRHARSLIADGTRTG